MKLYSLTLGLVLSGCLPGKVVFDDWPDDTGKTDTADADTDTDSDSDTDTDSDTDSDTDTDSGPVDSDGDGATDDIDCEPTNPAVYPGATEVCNEVDDDCDGDIDEGDAAPGVWYEDVDSDGYGNAEVSTTACDQPEGYVADGSDCDDYDADFHPGADESDCTDPADYNCDGSTGMVDGDGDGYAACEECDDGNATINPSATEVCDLGNTDEDCNGSADNDDASADPSTMTEFYEDVDGDSYGDVADSFCDEPLGYSSVDGDCNDADINVNPSATETCATPGDDNCDSSDDNSAFDASTWYRDIDGDGYGDPATAETTCTARAGYIGDATDCNDSDSGINPGALETCDGGGYIDEDCDGLTDDADPSVVDAGTFYLDADSDGYGDSSAVTTACEQPAGYSSVDGDCDDSNADAAPGNDEHCDGVDNDCNGLADGDDPDGDGYDVCSDCNESRADINPGEVEVCDGVDNNCDSSVDEDSADDATTWYADSDSDGYGNASAFDVDCDQPTGYVENTDDCDDGDSGINPSATEVIADGIDEDCDGFETCYSDGDDDGYLDGLGNTLASADGDCSDANEGTTSDSTTDCDDARAEVNPGESENPTTVWDDDCDGFAHDDGTVYTGTVQDGASPAAASITFTGANWIGDVVGDLSADSLFESSTALGTAGAAGTTVWEVMEDSTHTFTPASFTVDNTTWSSTLSGTYPGLQMLRGTSTLSVCTGVEFTGLTTGDKYGFAADFKNSDVSAVTVVIETGLWYAIYGGVNEMVTVSLPAGTDQQLIGGFVADSSTEQIYVCARPTTAGTLSLAHAWFSEASW